MKFRTIVNLLIVLISFSCAQRTSKGELPTQKRASQDIESSSGLHIENGPNQGLFFTDKQGTEYSHAYETIINNKIILESLNLYKHALIPSY